MSEPKDRALGGAATADTEFFTVGPPLHAVRPGYVRRDADDALCRSVSAGRDAYVFAPERSGKTSLIAATSARLQNNGFLVATLDLAQIGERDAGADAGRWYYSVAYRLLRQLRLKIDLQSWWQDKSILSSRQRLFEFYIEVLLANTKRPIVVFVDELQCIEGLPFADELLQSLSSVHKARATEPDFERLNFVLVGECDAGVLAPDAASSPFNMMDEVPLADFSRPQLDVFAAELNLDSEDSAAALDRIHYWTAGQPYLTQKLARAIARETLDDDVLEHVDRIVQQRFGFRAAVGNEPHLSHIHRRIVADRKRYEAMLNTYGRIRKGIAVVYEPETHAQRMLIALGLLVVQPDGQLAVRNRLYALVFTARWANENLPVHWRGPAIAAGVLLLLTAIPFWYTQLLPKPYARVLTSGSLELESVADAYHNLRSFPGHAETADRLFVYQLRQRAGLARDEATIGAIVQQAVQVPGQEEFGEELLAGYWDRQTQRALRGERRDDALLASLEALVVATPKRRRIANALVGRDYPSLLGTLATPAAERLVFNPQNRLLSAVNGAQIRQWSLTADGLQERPSWAVSALEVTPLLRRVIVDRAGSVARLGLAVDVSHMRLNDLRLRLIAPSGRAVELVFAASASAANEELRFAAADLSSLIGEPLSGTWTLSIRDEAASFAGHLVGWKLSLNSQVVEEDFERGLDIPEPVERESDSIWLAADGRYAVARSLQSDSARLWDLTYAQPARTVAVPAGENVLGVGPDAATLVTATQNVVTVWDARTGARRSTIDIGTAADVTLIDDGRRLLTGESAAEETTYRLWDLQDGQQLAAVGVAGLPALATADPSGAYLAVADYDQAVRVWEFASGRMQSQIDLRDQPSALAMARGGQALAAVYGTEGFSVWLTERPEQPLLTRRAEDRWEVRFSPSGEKFLAGGSRSGFQVFRSSDGVAYGPSLGSGLSAIADRLLAFSSDERVVVTGSANDSTRFWRAPAEAGSEPLDAQTSKATTAWLRRHKQDWVASLAPGGTRLALGDRDGQVNVVDLSATASANAGEVNFVGHIARVTDLEFSGDGALVASAAADGSIRLWDGESGMPRPFRIPTQANDVDRLQFSVSNRHLAALIGQRVIVIDTLSGNLVVNRELGEPQADLAFGADEQLYLAGESGALRRLSADQLGIWNVQNVWQGPYPLRRIRISPNRQMMIIADSRNVVQVFDIGRGTIGTVRLDLPDMVSDILFSRSESRVVIRTARWVHRADISRSGIHWREALRAPEMAYGAAMVFDWRAASSAGGAAGRDERLLLLTHESGFPELAQLDFSFATGPLLFGSHFELVNEWRDKLRGAE